MKNWSKLIMLFSATILMSCGEKQEEKEQIRIGDYDKRAEVNTNPDIESANATQTETESSEVASVAEVEITGNDQMQFNKNEIRVKAGQTVRLTLKHVGTMPKNAMGHNFVLLKKGTDITEFGNAAATAEANGYIPEGTDKVIANTQMLGGGEEATIEFEAPTPGTYTFICSFPGHYALMKGEFIVE